MRPVVEMIAVHKHYHANGGVIQALRDVNLVLEEGSFTALVGRSGCGKSTLLSLAGAVDLPTSGEVRIDAVATSQLDDEALSRLRRTRIGFVFQFFHLLPTLSVSENIALPLLLDPQGRASQARARAAELAERMGLAEKADLYPHQLSGGEMQRVAIARALAADPALIIADEPTGNLDSANAAMVLEWIARISHEMGRTVLMATHSREAAAAASRVIEMRDGKLLPPAAN
ncbi:MAG TPA: ABC transporter ATP-binding protein [Terriglobia bacterium]|nr:ABC transporter ATP-binding protein [Terriglobia bacterium]